jgi:CRISPR-associated protein Csx3
MYFGSGNSASSFSFHLHCIKREEFMIAAGAYDSDQDWSVSMVPLLPAIVIGGPPHAGKSVLFYSLTRTLHERGVRHHAIRACPDGEGNWYQEVQRVLDPESIRLLRVKKAWTGDFVQGICRDLERRHLPLLVDVGGQPEEWQQRILHACTHALLVLRDDQPESADFWRALVKRAGLLLLAECFSQRDDISTVSATLPILKGTLANLERGIPTQGECFNALIERITALFASYSLAELEQAKLAHAPAEFPVNLDPLLHKLDSQATLWTPAMLKRLPDELPRDRALAIYGRGPGWLYAMLAVLAGQQPFYQFDPRIGWLAPPTLQLGAQPSSGEISVRLQPCQDAHILSIRINTDYLDHLQAEQLMFPSLPATGGIIIDGKIPHWLLTALARLYAQAGMAWIACYQPELKTAVVVASRDAAHAPGDLIPMPDTSNSHSITNSGIK